jgi:hypothetical protein
MHPKHFAPYQSASDFPSKKRKGFEKALKQIEMDRYILISCLFLVLHTGFIASSNE